MKIRFLLLFLLLNTFYLFSEHRGLFLQFGLGSPNTSYAYVEDPVIGDLLEVTMDEIGFNKVFPFYSDFTLGYSFWGNTYLTGSLCFFTDQFGFTSEYQIFYTNALLGGGVRTYPHDTGFYWGADIVSHDLEREITYDTTITELKSYLGYGGRLRTGYDFDKDPNGLSFNINADILCSYVAEGCILSTSLYAALTWK